jgi:hypothetical protein
MCWRGFHTLSHALLYHLVVRYITANYTIICKGITLVGYLWLPQSHEVTFKRGYRE